MPNNRRLNTTVDSKVYEEVHRIAHECGIQSTLVVRVALQYGLQSAGAVLRRTFVPPPSEKDA